MSKQKLALIEGSYPSLMAGGVQCTQLYDNADLNDCVPEKDKVFQAWVCTGNGTSDTMSNTPFANFGRTFYLTAVKTWYNAQDNSRFRVVQTLYSISGYGDRMIWTRSIDGAGTLGWSDWKEMVVADGSYPTLGAGYLAKTVTLSTTTNSAQYGWWRFARLPFSTLTQISGTSSYSAILLVNSVNPSGISSPGAIQSGLIELDLRLDGGEPTSINANDVMKVLCGGLSPDMFCCTVSDTEIEFCGYLNGAYNRRNFTVLNEVYQNGVRVDALEFEPTFVSSSAPANAVYAVVRNLASSLGGKEADEFVDTTSNQSVGGQKTFTQTVHFDVDNNYSMGIDGIPAGNYKDIVFNDEDGDRIATIRVQNNTDDTSPDTRILIGSNGPEHTAPEGVTIIRDATRTRVEVVQPPASANNAEIATTSWVVDKGYLTAVPAASQTVLGGVKVYKDSEGYLNIDTQ